MKALLLIPVGFLSACSLFPLQQTQAENPFFAPSTLPYQMPDFGRIENAHYGPALERGMAEQNAEIEAIVSQAEAASFENTIVAMERSGQTLDRVSRVFYNLSGAHTNDEIQAVEAEFSPKLTAHRDGIFLNKALFQRVESLYQNIDELSLDKESQRLLSRYRTMFVRAGARLNEAQKVQLRAINAELSELQTSFRQNLMKDTNDLALVVDDAAELAGLSEGEIAAAAESAKSRGLEGKYLLTLKLPTPQPLMKRLENRELRKRLHQASIERGKRGNEFDTRDVLTRIAQLRAERAALLGYDTHAAFVLEDATAKSTDAVNNMLGKLAPAAVTNAKAEAKDLQALINAEGGKFKLAAWDWDYYAEKLRKERYAFDEASMKPYLEMNRVLVDGVFYMAKLVYGLSFKARPDLPTYHPDVQIFEAFEENGDGLGLFVFDPYARDSKRGGAWMNSYVEQSHLMGQKPVVGNHLNIPKPPEGQATLLTFGEVNTLFHEFGHAVHGLFSDVKYPLFSGTSVPRDFVEFPSQVHEMWAVWPSILTNYAKHYETGVAMPQELVDRFLAARKFNQGYGTTSYLSATLLDQAWHQRPASAGQIKDAIKFEAKALKRAAIDMPEIPPRYRSSYFAHIFAGGYSAGYYSYIWSEVLDAETVEWFKDHDGPKRINGDWFRAQLLSRGGAEDAMELFRKFRGRPPEIGPLLERRGLTAAE